MSIPTQYEQFVGSPYPRVYTSLNGGANSGQFDEYDEDPQPSTGPFVLKSAYDALYELLRERQTSGIQTALEDGTPFTFIGTEPSLREKIDAACKEAAEHGENFSFSGNVVRETGLRSNRIPNPEFEAASLPTTPDGRYPVVAADDPDREEIVADHLRTGKGIGIDYTNSTQEDRKLMVIPHDDPSMLGKLNHARHTGQRVAIEISPEIEAELQKVRVLTGNEPRPDRPFEVYNPIDPIPGLFQHVDHGRNPVPPSTAVPPYAYPQTHYERKVSQEGEAAMPSNTNPEETIRRMFGDTPGADL